MDSNHTTKGGVTSLEDSNSNCNTKEDGVAAVNLSSNETSSQYEKDHAAARNDTTSSNSDRLPFQSDHGNAAVQHQISPPLSMPLSAVPVSTLLDDHCQPFFAETNQRNAQENDDLDARIATKIVQDRLRQFKPQDELLTTTKLNKSEPTKKASAPMPPDDTSFWDSSGALDAHTVTKIVQERLAFSNQHDVDNPPPPTARRRLESKPGAVSVAGPGLDHSTPSSAVFSDSEEPSTTTVRQSQILDRRNLVEATLVDSQILTHAELMDESYQTSNVAAFDEVEGIQKKYCRAKGIVVVCLVLIVAGGIAGGIQRNKIMARLNPNENSPSEPSGYPPFSKVLKALTVEQIEDNPSSPQARANQWMWEDPNLNNYDEWRQLNRFGLATLYFATNGDNWTQNDLWLDYNTHECLWYSSHPDPICDDQFMIYQYLNLSANNLRGTVPLEVRHVDPSKYLDLSNNFIAGTPPPVGREARMEGIVVSNNDFYVGPNTTIGWVGPLLRVLRMDGNRLRLEMPSNFHLFLPGLEELDASRNEFVGPLPDSFTNTVPLRILRLGDNQMTGPFPKSISVLPNLEEFNISGNVGVSGPLPQEIGQISTLTLLDISRTFLTGTIPDELCHLEAIGQLEIVADCQMVRCCGK